MKTAAEQLSELETIFAALAHESRRHILVVLQMRGGRMTSGEIAERFACRWPTTTRHLRLLEAAGLVRVEKRGRERIYHLNRGDLTRVVGGWVKWFEKPLPPSSARRRNKSTGGAVKSS